MVLDKERRGWLLCIVVGVLSAMIMTLVLVWVNIERTDISYFFNSLQADLREKKAHKAKLEVEREYLLSPRELGRKAKKLGLQQPTANQIRWREDI